MTGEEFLQLHQATGQKESPQPAHSLVKKYVYGIHGISQLLFSAMQHPKNIFGRFSRVRSAVHPF